MRGAILYNFVKKFTDKLTFDQISAASRGVSYVDSQGNAPDERFSLLHLGLTRAERARGPKDFYPN